MKTVIFIFILINLLLQANFLAADSVYQQHNYDHTYFSVQASVNVDFVNPAVQTNRYKHYVIKVYDGDTITLKNGERVRLLGINAPEIESRYRQGEIGGQKAKQWLKAKLSYGEVMLEFDSQRRDKYKRLLAHVFLPNGEHLNKEIIAAGLATLSIIPPNTHYLKILKKAESQAHNNGLGIWSMEAYRPISIDNWPNKISGWRRFLARPKEIKKSQKYVRLILSDKVDVRISKLNLALFPDLKIYLGKNLEIHGWASKNKGHYSILVRHPSAIILL